MKYLIRSVKYFVGLCVLIAAVVLILNLTGMGASSAETIFAMLFHTTRGWILTGLVIVLTALYPRIGYTTLRVEGNMALDSVHLADALREAGFEPAGGTHGTRFFRAANPVRRVLLRFDRVSAAQQGAYIELEGPRKVLARVENPLKRRIGQNHENA